MAKGKKKDVSWEDLIEPMVIEVSETRQLHFGVSQPDDATMDTLVNIRTWERYLSADERKAGVEIEDVEFRPTQKGFTVPVDLFREFVDNVVALQEFLEEEGLIEEEDAEE